MYVCIETQFLHNIKKSSPKERISLYYDSDQIKKNADEDACAIDRGGDAKIALPIFMHAEEDEQSHARIGDESRKQGARGDHTRKEKLCQNDRGRAVGDQADESCQKRCENACVCRKCGEIFFADEMDGGADEKRKNEDKKCDLRCVDERRKEDAVFAVTVFFLAEMRDLFLSVCFFIEAAEEIYKKTDGDAAGNLDAEDGKDTRKSDAFRDHDREHLIGCGNEDGNERAC